MTDDMQALKDDISFLRALAQESRTPHHLGGAIILTAGVTFAVASTVNWAIISHLVAVSPWVGAGAWAAALALTLLAVAMVKARSPSLRTPGIRAAGIVWAGVGWAIFSLATAIAIVCWRTQSYIPVLLFPSFILALYGAAWSVAAVVPAKRWIWLTAIGSYVAAPLVALPAPGPNGLLAYAVALILLAAIPGAVLMRKEPSAA
jgi:hypothetical protein